LLASTRADALGHKRRFYVFYGEAMHSHRPGETEPGERRTPGRHLKNEPGNAGRSVKHTEQVQEILRSSEVRCGAGLQHVVG
jgi:hypothetical protein